MAIEIGIPTSVSDIVQAIKDESIEPSELHTDESDITDRLNPPSVATAGDLPADADAKEPDIVWVEDEELWYTYTN